MAQVEINHIAVAEFAGAACLLLLPEGLREFVSRPQLHVFVFRLAQRRFRAQAVILQIAIAIFIKQNATFAPARFGNQNARTGQARRVVLHKLHIPQRHTMTIGHRHTVAGDNACVGIEAEQAPSAAGGKNHRFSAQQSQFTGGDLQGNHANHGTFMYRQIEHKELIKALDLWVL